MKKLLFNPFEKYAGSLSVFIALLILFLSSLVANLGMIHFDGVIDMHLGAETTFMYSFLEGLIDWLCMVLFIYLSALIFSPSSIRLVDVLGTQGMARFPFFITGIFSWLISTEKMEKFIQYKVLHQGESVEITVLDGLAFGLVSLITLTCLIWMIYLMFKAYAVSCNMKGGKAVSSFIVSLLLAEILSKALLYFLYKSA